MLPHTLWGQHHPYTKPRQKKLQANITEEHRCKNPQQNIIKLNLTIHYKDHKPCSSGIYPRVAKIFQYLYINVIHHINKLKNKDHMITFSSLQSLSRVLLFATPWTAAHQASLSTTSSLSSPKPMSTESVMPSNHLILCHPLLLLPSVFPSIRVWLKLPVFVPRKKRNWPTSPQPILDVEIITTLLSLRPDQTVSKHCLGLVFVIRTKLLGWWNVAFCR